MTILLFHRLPLLLLRATCQEGDLLGGVLGDGRRDGLLGGENSLPLKVDFLLSSCRERPGTVLTGLLAALLLGSGDGDLEYD